jgi:tRNA A37 threonylcarbamoyladenosine dehydratase
MTRASDYRDRFGGIARLYGAAALARLRAAHVGVVGVGGVGSWAVEALARSGVGALTLIDLDDVSIANVNRQLPALDGTIGQPKVAVLAARVRAINPGCQVTAVPETFTAATAERLLATPCDWVIDAIDRLANKCALIAACRQRGQRVHTVGGAAGKRDATRLHTADLGAARGDDLLRLGRKKLRRDHGFPPGEGAHFGVPCVYSDERPVYPWTDGTCCVEPEPGANRELEGGRGFGAAAYVTGAFGFAAAGVVVRAVTGDR